VTLDLDWPSLEQSLDERGYAAAPKPVLSDDECAELVSLYDDDARFRSRIDMGRYRFGQGEYKYFAKPLPRVVSELRQRLYAPLAQIANRWMEQLGDSERYPATHASFLERCAKAGQTKPTPLLLRYEAGGYNCLHQDVYGDVAFPYRPSSFSPSAASTTRAANFFSSNNVPAPNQWATSSRPRRAGLRSSRRESGRFVGRAVSIACKCVTV
jgi:hypothetical protein